MLLFQVVEQDHEYKAFILEWWWNAMERKRIQATQHVGHSRNLSETCADAGGHTEEMKIVQVVQDTLHAATKKEMKSV